MLCDLAKNAPERSMRTLPPFLALAAALMVTGCAQRAARSAPEPGAHQAAAAVATPPTPDASGDGVYTSEQAQRGRGVFRETCLECHYSSEFRNSTFKFQWRRRSVWDLYREIVRTMPEDKPGALADQQYIDVVAYILELNKHVPGTAELTVDEAVLDTIPMAAPSGARP